MDTGTLLDDPGVDWGFTAFNVALAYVLVGGAWITLSDRFLSALVAPGPLREIVAMGKGWLFVAASGAVLYVSMTRRERAARRTNRRLDRALQQSSILHRVLRHNLRNTCNLIQGYSELLAAGDHDDDTLRAITRKTDKLIGFSEKSRHLKALLIDDAVSRGAIDVVPIVEERIERARADHPEARIHAELPDRAWARTYSRFGIVLEELIENGVEHNDAEVPEVWVAVEPTADGTVRVDVADNGPGVPEMERDILEAGLEKPLFHSEGLGLWLVRVFVTQSGGDIGIVDNEPRGTVVRITLPAATAREEPEGAVTAITR